MRQIILVEGKFYRSRVMFDPGALEFPKDEVPVVFNFRMDARSFLGKAGDFQRDENHNVTAEITLNDDEKWENLLENCDASVYCDGVVRERTKDGQVVHTANLKAVSFILKQTPTEVSWHPIEGNQSDGH